jgi:hypothetical protein
MYNLFMEFSLDDLNQSLNTFDFLVGFGVLISYLIVDAMYAHYNLAVTEHKALAAANTGALMHFLLAFGGLSYVQNYLYLIPIARGSWIGTYLVVSRRKR